MFLVVGLGNCEKKYDNTYHNVGFSVLDEYFKGTDVKFKKLKYRALCVEENYFGEKVIFIKPQTYMNLSGESVRLYLEKFHIEPKNMIVIYDDLDVNSGEIRFRKSGSAGSHNGMRNIVKEIGSTEFNRIRVGTKPKKEIHNIIDFVLSVPCEDEKENIQIGIEKAVEGLKEFLEKKGNVENYTK